MPKHPGVRADWPVDARARSLEGELDGLKGKRSVLERKLASLTASPPPQQRSPIRQASSPGPVVGGGALQASDL